MPHFSLVLDLKDPSRRLNPLCGTASSEKGRAIRTFPCGKHQLMVARVNERRFQVDKIINSSAMAVQPPNGHVENESPVPYTDLFYDPQDSRNSVLKLIYWVRPEWKRYSQDLQFTKFTEGITNTVCEALLHEHVP